MTCNWASGQIASAVSTEGRRAALEAARLELVAVGEAQPHTTTILAAAALLECLQARAATTGGAARNGGAAGWLGAPATVLDVGAGSGVLAALALGAGARSAIGIERDAALVAAGRRLHPCVDLLEADALAGLPLGPFTIVVANLPVPTLHRVIPALAASAGATVIVTGARLVQGPPLRRALERIGLRHITATAAHGWCAYRASG
jgi:ribosomal protein L11 methylase PrmA